MHDTEINIVRLTPEMSEDYLNFFDATPHSTGKSEDKCYCVCWTSCSGDLEACATSEKRRETAMEYIKKQYIQGYLAYVGDRVVGWCNANVKSDCYECISWRMFMQNIKREDKKVKSVFCFAVAPEYRGKGIAGKLLTRVCEDAKKEGFDFVEVYPNISFIDEEQDFMGPVSMYEKMGFVEEYKADGRCIMTKKFN